MKRFLISFMMAGALLAGGWAVNAAPPNFAGTWVLDKGKSQLPRQLENVESYTMVVTQDAQQLTVEHKIVGGGRPSGDRRDSSGQSGDQGSGRRQGEQGGERGYGRGRGGFGGGMPSATYKLDGSETRMEATSDRGGAATFRAQVKDSGKVLELTNTRTFNFQGNDMTRTTTERWELADGGKVLKVKRTSEGRQGPQESTLVFTKQ